MSVSVIIPALNEAKALQQTLDAVLVQRGNFDVTVVDGGSDDSTVEIAKANTGVCVTCSQRGRSFQMNHGARLTIGDWLLFLHADTLLPDKAIEKIDSLSQTDTQSGCFHHQFSGSGFLLRTISKLHNWRFSRTGVIYGDQGFFIRRSMFEKIGGFPPVSMLEDVLISEQLIKQTKPIMLEETVITDARKFVKRGVVRSLLEVILIQICHELKIPVTVRSFFSPVR